MSILSDKVEQVEMLNSGKGIQYLLNETYKALGNPIVMFDTDYNLMSNTEGVTTDDPIWNEIIAKGTFTHETQELLKEEGFFDAVANAKTIAFLLSDKIKYDVIWGKVFNGNHTHVANLAITGCNRPFCSDDIVVFEAVCKLFSNEISKNEIYQNYEKIFEETLIRKLIDENITNKELYSAHIAILYDGLKPNLYVAAVDVAQCDPAYSKLTYFRDVVRHMQPAFKYSIYSNYIVIIISSDNATLNIKKDLYKLNRLFKQKKIFAGISGCFENLYELPEFYSDAVKALKLGLTSSGDRQIFLYDGVTPN